MNRKDLQVLAKLRLREARVLLDNQCYEGAYYLAGYAIECALKACIAKQFRQHDFPDKKVVMDSYSHDVEQLIRVAGLKSNLDAMIQSDPDFQLNWTLVRQWSEQARYRTFVAQKDAQDLYEAITVRRSGVIPWLKKLW